MTDVDTFYDSLGDALEERFADYIDINTGTLKVDADGDPVELPANVDDDLYELADQGVPVYTADLVNVRLGLGCPEPEDYSGDTLEGGIRVAVYGSALAYILDSAERYGLTN